MVEQSAIERKIAVIDDNPTFRSNLSELLKINGFEPLPLAGSHELDRLDEPAQVDMAIIDLHLEGESGLDLVQSIRAKAEIPIIMFTGIGDEVDKIIGLEAGADDYLMKPINSRELIARVRAVFRRYGHSRHRQHRNNAAASLQTFGEFSVEPNQRRLYDRNGREIPLTNSEFRLIEYFLRNPNRVIDRVELLKYLGSDCSEYIDRSIDVLILRLRRKIEICPSKPVHLQTRRGRGYVLVQAVAAEVA